MSWPHQDAVWRLALPAARKLTLLALADQACATTGEVALSRTRIARMTGLSASTIKRETRQLIAAGLLEATTVATKVASYRYRLTLVGCKVTSGHGDQRSNAAIGRGHPEPHLIPITDPLKAVQASRGREISTGPRKETPTSGQLLKLVHVLIDDSQVEISDAGDLVDRLKRACAQADFVYDSGRVNAAVNQALAARGLKPWLPMKGQRR